MDHLYQARRLSCLSKWTVLVRRLKPCFRFVEFLKIKFKLKDRIFSSMSQTVKHGGTIKPKEIEFSMIHPPLKFEINKKLLNANFHFYLPPSCYSIIYLT